MQVIKQFRFVSRFGWLCYSLKLTEFLGGRAAPYSPTIILYIEDECYTWTFIESVFL